MNYFSGVYSLLLLSVYGTVEKNYCLAINVRDFLFSVIKLM